MIGDVIEFSKEECGDMLRGGPALPNRAEVAEVLKGGNRIPPSGAPVGENNDPDDEVCSNLKV